MLVVFGTGDQLEIVGEEFLATHRAAVAVIDVAAALDDLTVCFQLVSIEIDDAL